MQSNTLIKCKTALVILNYNGRFFLEKFLPSVTQHTNQAQLVIIDNASTDDSVTFLNTHYPQIPLIQNADNQGFSKGYNTGLKQIEAEYYVLLNSDVEVSPNWLEPLLSLMENNPQIAACQPKIKAECEKTSFEAAGAAGGFIDKWGFPFCRGRIFDHLEKDEGQYEDNVEVFWASGACLLIRAKLYHEMGGLDEDFFAHMEEIDLCWRLKNAGHQIYHCSESEVYHVGGGTLPKSSPFKTYLNFRNNLAMLLKNLPSEHLPRIFIRMVLDGIAAVKFLLSGEFSNFWSVAKSHFHFYARIPKILKARKLQKIKQNHSQMYNSSIVWQYFAKKRKTFSELMNN
jgi:GT2 family glycosyltransferase